jgi:uncharacterized membrane protein YeaQ/YmgE (transglycosylase-associated protein family)
MLHFLWYLVVGFVVGLIARAVLDPRLRSLTNF